MDEKICKKKLPLTKSERERERDSFRWILCITWRSQINISLGKSNSFRSVFIHFDFSVVAGKEAQFQKHSNLKIYIRRCASISTAYYLLVHLPIYLIPGSKIFVTHVVRRPYYSPTCTTSKVVLQCIRTGAGTINSHTNGLRRATSVVVVGEESAQ